MPYDAFGPTGYIDVGTTASVVWPTWVAIYGTSSSSTNVTYSGTWDNWVLANGSYTTTNLTFTQAWNGWQTIPHQQMFRSGYQCVPKLPETAEQKAAREAREVQMREEARVREEKWKKQQEEVIRTRAIADRRASKLLRSCLTAEQIADLEKSNYFLVKTPDGRTFRIDYGAHANVKELNKNGKPVKSYCIQPDDVPPGDAMLAQKFMIETDLPRFERIANITPIYN